MNGIDNEGSTSDLSNAQVITLAVATLPVAALSVASSSVLVYMAMHKKKGVDSLGRILIAMSTCDMISTTQTCFQQFLAPTKDASPRITRPDDNDSPICNALGFLWQFAFTCFWYNGLLSFYYVTTIVYGWKEEKFQKYEPFLHALCLGFAFVTASVGSIVKWYGMNEIGGGCWVNDFPRNCGPEPHQTGKECLSGEIAWFVGGIPVVCLMILVLVNNLLIYRHVRGTLFRSQQHSIVNLDAQARRLRQVSIQCFLYVLAFWCTTIPSIILRNLEATGFTADKESSIFPLLLWQSIAVPSTGFWNLLVYLRPRYMRHRQGSPTETRWWAFRRAVFGNRQSSSNVVRYKLAWQTPRATVNSNDGGHQKTNQNAIHNNSFPSDAKSSGMEPCTNDDIVNTSTDKVCKGRENLSPNGAIAS